MTTTKKRTSRRPNVQPTRTKGTGLSRHRERTRTTHAEIDLRIIRVGEVLLEGLTRREIQDRFCDEWGLSPKTIDTYISRARLMLEANISGSAESWQSFFNEAMADLRHRAKEADDLRLELDVLKDWKRQLGVYAPEKSQVTSLSEYGDMTEQERAKQLAQLVEVAQQRAKEERGQPVDTATREDLFMRSDPTQTGNPEA